MEYVSLISLFQGSETCNMASSVHSWRNVCLHCSDCQTNVKKRKGKHRYFQYRFLIGKRNSNNKTEQVASNSNNSDLYLGGVSLNLNWATNYSKLFNDFLQTLMANIKLVTYITPVISNSLFTLI